MHINSTSRGITLIELIIFIAIVSVALTAVILVYINTSRYSADPMIRIRSIELAQSTLEEILLKKYDESTPQGGGCVRFPAGSSRCAAGNPTATAQTEAAFGPDGETRATYDDVDDYHNRLYCGQGVVPARTGCPALSCSNLLDESGNDISAAYRGYAVCIKVAFAGGAGAEINAVSPAPANDVSLNDAKRIDVIVSDPLNSRMKLSSYRLNF